MTLISQTQLKDSWNNVKAHCAVLKLNIRIYIKQLSHSGLFGQNIILNTTVKQTGRKTKLEQKELSIISVPGRCFFSFLLIGSTRKWNTTQFFLFDLKLLHVTVPRHNLFFLMLFLTFFWIPSPAAPPAAQPRLCLKGRTLFTGWINQRERMTDDPNGNREMQVRENGKPWRNSSAKTPYTML